MQLRLLIDLFIRFLKIGVVGFGGGWAILPLIHKEIVEEAGWMNESEFMNLVAIAGSTPGPVAVNAATYTGFRLAGLAGAVIATLAVVIPPFTAISVIVYTVSSYFGSKYVRAVLSTLKAGVVGLIIVAFCTTFRETYSGTSGIVQILILAAVTVYTVTAIAVFRIHPFYIVLSLIPIGIILGAIGLI